MKLTDLGLTPVGMAATAKLGHQVQKASVAAAKEPRLNLGVLGISIGQKQSTGDTSRVVRGTALGGKKPTPMLRRLFTPVPFKTMNEEMTGKSIIELLNHLHREMAGNDMRLPDLFDEEAAVRDAIHLVVERDTDLDAAQEALGAATKMLNTFPISQMEKVSDTSEIITNTGVMLSSPTKEWIEAVQFVHNNYQTLSNHWEAVEYIANVIIDLQEQRPDSPHFAFANAALAKLGLR